MKWFTIPYRSFWFDGEPYTKILLPPSVKNLFDLLRKTKGSYIGIADNNAQLFIDNQPIIRIDTNSIGDVKELCDDVREYIEINEYRISENRVKQILSYYQS